LERLGQLTRNADARAQPARRWPTLIEIIYQELTEKK
jgi:hypothetical protein